MRCTSWLQNEHLNLESYPILSTNSPQLLNVLSNSSGIQLRDCGTFYYHNVHCSGNRKHRDTISLPLKIEQHISQYEYTELWLCFLCMWLPIHRTQISDNSSLHFHFIDAHGNKRIRVIEGGWFYHLHILLISAHPFCASVMSAALLPPQSPACERASTCWWSDLPRELGFGSLAGDGGDEHEVSLEVGYMGLKWLLFLTSSLLLGYEWNTWLRAASDYTVTP